WRISFAHGPGAAAGKRDCRRTMGCAGTPVDVSVRSSIRNTDAVGPGRAATAAPAWGAAEWDSGSSTRLTTTRMPWTQGAHERTIPAHLKRKMGAPRSGAAESTMQAHAEK